MRVETELVEGVDGVVGGVAEGRVEGRRDEAGVAGAEERDHGEAVAEGGGRAGWLEGLATRWGEEDLVEREGGGRGAGDGEMAEVGWVEAAAEEAYAHKIAIGGGPPPGILVKTGAHWS